MLASDRGLQTPLIGSLLVLASLLYLLRLSTFQVGSWGDDAQYIITARTLAAGHGYALDTYPGAPPQLQYPPGYPLLLVPLAALAPGSLWVFSLPSVILTLAALMIWFVLLRRRVAFVPALVILCAIATNFVITQFAAMVMSEAAFLFLAALLFLLLDSYMRQNYSSRSWPFFIALVLIALYFTRTIGIVFVPATLACLLVARRFKASLIIVFLFAIPFAAWTYRNIAMPGGGVLSPGYERQLRDVTRASTVQMSPSNVVVDRVQAVARNGRDYATIVTADTLLHNVSGHRAAPALSKLGLSWLPSLAGFVIATLIVIGFVYRLRTWPSILEISGAFYLAGLLLWPFPQSRFLHSFVPLLYLLVFDGLRVCFRCIPRTQAYRFHRTRFALIVVAMLIAVSIFRDVQAIIDPVRNRIPDLEIGSAWIAENSPPNSIVMAASPHSRYLYTHRQMTDFPEKPRLDADEYIEMVRQSGAGYILIAPPQRAVGSTDLDAVTTGLEHALMARQDEFRLVFEDGAANVRIYQRNDSNRPASESSLSGA
jgi:hypothetical protein